ncbi:hypothetical protein Tco_1402886 [Tanacetum coccineum]
MDDDLFTYEVEVADTPCDSNMDDDSEREADDDMGYDPSDIRGNDEVELTNEESSDNKDDVAEVFRIDTNIFDYETPLCLAFNEFNYLLKENVPWVYDKPWLDNRIWKEPTLVKHHCKPFNYKTGCLEWPTCSWREDSYCIGGNLPDAYIIGNSLHYQDLEWYETLEDYELKKEALRNKAIMEGLIEEDSDDESRYELRRRWNVYTSYDDAYEINHDVAVRKEFYEIRELSVCNIRRFEMINYLFGQDKEYVAIKEDEYDDLARTRKDACRAY